MCDGEISLLCLGPLTNIAVAMRLDPELTTRVQNLYAMGETMRVRTARYNILDTTLIKTVMPPLDNRKWQRKNLLDSHCYFLPLPVGSGANLRL